MKGIILLMFVIWQVLFEKLKSVKILTICPWDSNSCPTHHAVALMVQYVNVRQHKLGTVIIHTVHIPQHDRADTGSLPKKDFALPTQITSNKPSQAVVPLYLCTIIVKKNVNRINLNLYCTLSGGII